MNCICAHDLMTSRWSDVDIVSAMLTPSTLSVMIHNDDGLSRRHDGSQLTDNEFDDVSEDQFLRRRCDHMCQLSVSRLLYVGISSSVEAYSGSLLCNVRHKQRVACARYL